MNITDQELEEEPQFENSAFQIRTPQSEILADLNMSHRVVNDSKHRIQELNLKLSQKASRLQITEQKYNNLLKQFL